MRNRVIPLLVFLSAAGAVAGCQSNSTNAVEVTIRLAESTPALKRGTITVDYRQSGATVESKGGQPACASILPHVTCGFSDDGSKLTIEAEASQGFSGPTDLAVCRMIPADAGTAPEKISSGLRVVVVQAEGRDGEPVVIAAAGKDGARNPAPGGTPGSGRDASAGGGSYQGPGAANAPTAGQAEVAPGAPAQPGGQDGMVVTREDLQRRERQRAEEALAQRKATGGTSGSGREGATGSSGAAANAGGEGSEDTIEQEEPGTGSNDPTDYDDVATEYGVRFDLEATSGPVGALQFDVEYSGGAGGWRGAAAGADCRWMIAAALHACNDKRGGVLTCAVVDTNGFSGPTALMECGFKSRNSVSAGDFSVRVTDASDPALNPTNARVVVSAVYAR